VVDLDVSVCLLLPGKGLEVPTDELLERATAVEVNGLLTHFLAPEDVLLDLCTHLYKNSTVLRFMRRGKHRRLIKYVDLMEYLAKHRENFSWDAFMDRVSRYGVQQQVFYALAHAELLFPGEVPLEVLAALRASCADPERFLREYAQWDLPEPLSWAEAFGERFFSRIPDRSLPPTRSLV
jgi:Uncharacterised nucleotidyltransferase